MNLTTEQMQAILKGAPSGADIYCKAADCDESPYIDSEIEGECVNCIKLSDIRAELSSRQSVQAYFASDERGSIEQEQSVIERVRAVLKEIEESSHFDDHHRWMIEQDDVVAIIKRHFPELNEVSL